MLGCSILTRILYCYAHTPGYKATFNMLAFGGVVIHDAPHFTLVTIFAPKSGKVRVKYRKPDIE